MCDLCELGKATIQDGQLECSKWYVLLLAYVCSLFCIWVFKISLHLYSEKKKEDNMIWF
jgi:hypothetical protein